MAGSRGKTAGSGKGKIGAFQPSGDVRRIVPLKANYVYVNDHLGKLHHVNRDSQKFVDLCIAVDEAMGGRATEELKQLGWDSIVSKIEKTRANQEAQ